MPEAEDRSPVDQLVDLFVYAPVGLFYEYRDVLPKLITRGRSQVQLAKLLGTMAAKQGQRTVSERLDGVADVATSSVAEAITEVGAKIGLAPESDRGRATPSTAEGVESSEPLPIAGYGDLTAKQIIPLLGDLTAAQRTRVRRHESAHRARKTVLAKLDSLAAAD